MTVELGVAIEARLGDHRSRRISLDQANEQQTIRIDPELVGDGVARCCTDDDRPAPLPRRGVHHIEVEPEGVECLRRGFDGLRVHVEAEQEQWNDLVVMRFPFGCLAIWTSPYSPYFGTEEFNLLRSIGNLAYLALEQTRAAELKLQIAAANLRRKQALEINDNIVQGLAVAKYSFDLGQESKAREAIEGTLVAARSIISDLLDDLGGEMDLGPGALTRGHAATGFMESSITKDRKKDEEAP